MSNVYHETANVVFLSGAICMSTRRVLCLGYYVGPSQSCSRHSLKHGDVSISCVWLGVSGEATPQSGNPISLNQNALSSILSLNLGQRLGASSTLILDGGAQYHPSGLQLQAVYSLRCCLRPPQSVGAHLGSLSGWTSSLSHFPERGSFRDGDQLRTLRCVHLDVMSAQ